MAKIIEFKITVTPPLVDTASGSPSALDKMPHLKEPGRLIILPKTTEEIERGHQLGRSSDMATYTFVVNEASLSSLCQKIATAILSQTDVQDNKILVENSEVDEVISLRNTHVQELATRIFATATAS